MHLVQLKTQDSIRKVAVVDGSHLRLLDGVTTVYELAQKAITKSISLTDLIGKLQSDERCDYDLALSEGRILIPVDHPEPSRFFITGTGLTHLGSAEARSNMHKKLESSDLTDSMKMFKMGLENGKPAAGKIGVQPEWFYKGNGNIVVAPGGALTRPSFADDGGDEPEIVGLYIIGDDGTLYRIGFALGNEFSDHVMEQVNYLYLSHSKLRPCSFGPEILLGDLPSNVKGKVSIIRNNKTLWEKEFLSGEDNMTHTIRNLEAHHFKYSFFRQPGDLHCHFFGTSTFSFQGNIAIKDGDTLKIESDVFGRPLCNPVKYVKSGFVEVKTL